MQPPPAGIEACRVDAQTLADYDALRGEAIRHAVEASQQAFPEIYTRFGPAGREACADDLAFHLDFLRPVLETGEIATFTDYLKWLSQVLGSRGVPIRSVPRSLSDLAGFFEARLGDASLPIVNALAAGEAALAGSLAPDDDDPPGPDRWPQAQPYAAAAVQGDWAGAGRLLDEALEQGASLPLAALHVIHPAMVEVGRLWQNNLVSVAQEHVATALTQNLMAKAMARATAAPDNGRRALFACLAGNRHDLGVHMVADAFELDGWSVLNLSADVALADLLAELRSSAPHLVGLSASLPQHLGGVREAVAELRAALAGDCPRIVVGGRVFNQYPHLARWVGAELLGGDAVAAVAAGRASAGGTG